MRSRFQSSRFIRRVYLKPEKKAESLPIVAVYSSRLFEAGNKTGVASKQSHGIVRSSKEAFVEQVRRLTEDNAAYQHNYESWFLAHEHLRALNLNKQLQQEHAQLQQEQAQLQQETAQLRQETAQLQKYAELFKRLRAVAEEQGLL